MSLRFEHCDKYIFPCRFNARKGWWLPTLCCCQWQGEPNIVAQNIRTTKAKQGERGPLQRDYHYSPTVVACNLASSADRANDNHWLNPNNAVGLASVGKYPRKGSSIVVSRYLLRKIDDVQDRFTARSSANLKKYWNNSVIGFEQCREIGLTTPASASCRYRCGARVDCLRTVEQERHQNNQIIVWSL